MAFEVATGKYVLSFMPDVEQVTVLVMNTHRRHIGKFDIPGHQGERSMQELHLRLLQLLGQDSAESVRDVNRIVSEVRTVIDNARKILMCFGAVNKPKESTVETDNNGIREQLATGFSIRIFLVRDRAEHAVGWQLEICGVSGSGVSTVEVKLLTDVIDVQILKSWRERASEYCDSKERVDRFFANFISWLKDQPHDMQSLVSSSLLRSEA